LITVVVATHRANKRPRLRSGVHLPSTNGNNNAVTTLAPNAQRNCIAKLGKLAFFHCASGPIPIRKIAGVMSGTKTVSKYGGPTEIFPSPSASRNSGYNVPNKTDPIATTNRTLLARSIASRETRSNPPPNPTRGARQAYSKSDPPMTIARKTRINNPRFGSVAKAWTEVKTPERTRNVPSKLKENAIIANKTVQTLNPPRLSVTASEWINAVPANQGMKEAFSTGSQNHQPPQPSS